MAVAGYVTVTTALTAMVADRLRMTSRNQRRYGNQTVMTNQHPGPPTGSTEQSRR
jgi:hypothetical protein